METLPKELEDIILDYKCQLETHLKYEILKTEFKDTLEFEYHSIGPKLLRLTRINKYEKRYSTYCTKCGNYGEIAEAVYSQNDKRITHNKCDFNKETEFVYYHRNTSKYYKELPDRKFCYCVQDQYNENNILL